MNDWLVILIAVVVVVGGLALAVELDRWRRHRRREAGLRRIYDEAQAEVDEHAGVDRLRDRETRRLW